MTVENKKQPTGAQSAPPAPKPEAEKQATALKNRQKNGQYTGSLLG